MHKLLDNIQNWTQNGPAANDKMNPLAWLAAIGGIGSAYMGANSMQDVSIGKIEGYLDPWAQALGWDKDAEDWSGGGLMGQAKDFLNMDSEYNQQLRQQTLGDAQDAAANQMMMTERLQGPGMSGMLAQQGKQAANQATQQGQQNWLQQFYRQQGLGSQMMNQATQGMQAYTENIAQGYISNIQSQNMANAAMYGGLTSGLLGFVPGLS